MCLLQSGKALAIAIESLTMEGGGSIEDLDVDFTLPGYPDIELKVKEIGQIVTCTFFVLFESFPTTHSLGGKRYRSLYTTWTIT